MKIKFKRYFRPEECIRGITPRRLSAARRALQNERDKLPLFAEMIAAGQPTPEQRIESFDIGVVESTRESRIRRASRWREARDLLRKMSDQDRKGILDWWNRPVYPLDPEYLLDLIRQWTKDSWRPPFYGEEEHRKWEEGREKLKILFAKWRAEGRIKDRVAIDTTGVGS